VRRFIKIPKSQRGATLLEVALVVALVMIVAVPSLGYAGIMVAERNCNAAGSMSPTFDPGNPRTIWHFSLALNPPAQCLRCVYDLNGWPVNACDPMFLPD